MNETMNWGLLYALLSLDRVFPLYPRLAVPGDPRLLQLAIRRAIVKNRAIADHDPQLVDIEAVAQAAIEHDMGADGFASLRRWALDAFEDGSDRTKPWTVWKMIFQYLTMDAEAMAAIFRDHNTAVQSSYGRFSSDPVYDTIEALKQDPLSDWDSEMYARHAWSDEDLVSAPLNYVELTITGVNFRRFFHASVGNADSELLFDYGKRLVEKLGLAGLAPLARPERMASDA